MKNSKLIRCLIQKSKLGDIVSKLADNFYLNIKNQNTPE